MRFLRSALEGLDLWLRHQGGPPANSSVSCPMPASIAPLLPSVSSTMPSTMRIRLCLVRCPSIVSLLFAGSPCVSKPACQQEPYIFVALTRRGAGRHGGPSAICGLSVCQQASVPTAPHLPPQTARTHASYTGPQRKALEYQLPPCNSFLRLALHQALAAQYPSLRIMIRPREWKPRGSGSGSGGGGSWREWLSGKISGKKAQGDEVDGARVDSRRTWGTSDRVLVVARENDAR